MIHGVTFISATVTMITILVKIFHSPEKRGKGGGGGGGGGGGRGGEKPQRR